MRSRLALNVLLPFSLVLSSAASAFAQGSSATLATVPGKVRDLYAANSGELLYCSETGEVGRIDASGTVTVIADASDGLPTGLNAIVETPTGDVAVADAGGDIWVMAGGTGTPTLIYDDRFMIVEVSDMIVDATGNYILCSRTPSSGTRGMNWISGDGTRWAYYLVDESPLGVAVDPLTGDLLISDSAGIGALRMVDVQDETHPIAAIETGTNFGFQAAEGDGDVVFDVLGNAYIVGGGNIYRRDQVTGITSLWTGGLSQLRGAAIAPSTGNVTSATGWSLFVVENEGPAQIVEFGGVEAPASLVPASLGTVPSPGRQVHLWAGTAIRVFDMAVDLDGNLLVGGDLFGNSPQVRRLETTNFTWSVIADDSNGINDRVEGITVARDGTIFALTNRGFLHEIHEGPLSVTTLFTDPFGQIASALDMAMDRDGTLFIAERRGFNAGELFAFSGGILTALINTSELKGVMADPTTAGLLVTNWTGTGFCGTVNHFDFNAGTLNPLPGFSSMNYSNGNWGDGDMVMDVEGNIYTISEDDWRLTRYDPVKQRISNIGSSYLFHPSGLAIAPSSSTSASTTGWSLYVSEYDILWEIDSLPPPAPRLLDLSAPPVGELLAWLPRTGGEVRSMIADPAGGGLLLTTTAGTVERIDTTSGQRTTLFGPIPASDITAIGSFAGGDLVVCTSTGILLRLQANAGYAATLIWSNAGAELSDVRGLTVDGLDRVNIVAREAGTPTSKLWRLDNGVLEFLTHSSRGLRPAIDPQTGDLFVTQRGGLNDGVGEVLRVDTWTTPVSHGHWRGDSFYTFQHDGTDGGITFDADGNFYVVEGELGRIAHINRSTGSKTWVAGNYDHPTSVVLAPGTPGIAGALGTSLFVLDGWSVYEVGVDGLPPGPPPIAPPGLAPPADFQVTGNIQLSSNIPLTVQSAPHANRIYIIAPTLSGKVPGLPLSVFGTPDPRILPSNPDTLWNIIGSPLFLPNSISVLDGAGQSPAGTSVFIGPSPTVFNLNQFLDFVWIAIDITAPNRIAAVGGTAQLFLGN